MYIPVDMFMCILKCPHAVCCDAFSSTLVKHLRSWQKQHVRFSGDTGVTSTRGNLQVTPEASFQRYRSSQHMYNMHEWSQIRDSLHSSTLQFMLVREHAQWISTDRRYIHLLTRSCLGKG